MHHLLINHLPRTKDHLPRFLISLIYYYILPHRTHHYYYAIFEFHNPNHHFCFLDRPIVLFFQMNLHHPPGSYLRKACYIDSL